MQKKEVAMTDRKEMPEKKKSISFTVNGQMLNLEVDCRLTLAELLREELNLTGTKVGCNRGECGSCTVLLDRRPVYSCSMLAVEASGRTVETIESLSRNGALHPLQKSFIDHDALQCGYCTPGMIMSAKALLDKNPRPTKHDVRKAIDGNICRCGAYLNIIDATVDASRGIHSAEGKNG